MGPLAGLKIVEMSGLAPGPFAAMMLADMGTQVLRIARPDDGPLHDPRFQLLQRNRRSIAVDLKSKAGRDTVLRLLGQADGLIEGFRPGVMERLGLGPDVCLQANPRLVYGRMTGWGQTGPLAPRAGHDINYIALAGALDSIGNAGQPPTVPLNLIGDFGGGGMLLAFGMVCALLECQRSGQGQVIDAAMVDGASSLMMWVHGLRAAGRWAARGENGLSGVAPHYGVYETRDGLYVSVGASEPKFFDELMRSLGLDPSMLPNRRDPAHWATLKRMIAEVFKTRTRAEWTDLLQDADVCFAPVLGIEELADHPHHCARGSFVQVDGISQPAPAPRFSRTAPPAPTAGVEPGVDLQSALQGWGFSADEIGALQANATVV